MNEQQKGKILFIFIIIMLLGICLEAFQAGSSFLCTNSYSSTDYSDASILDSTPHMLLSDNLCMVEDYRQSQTNTSLRQATRRANIRISRIGFHIYALIVIMPMLVVSASVATFHDAFHEMFCSAIIINYIHQQDGEKVPLYS